MNNEALQKMAALNDGIMKRLGFKNISSTMKHCQMNKRYNQVNVTGNGQLSLIQVEDIFAAQFYLKRMDKKF